MSSYNISSLTSSLDPSWTLFLDRDGVINVNKKDSYVFNCREFVFAEGALEALVILREIFGRIIVVTNQRGVEKGLMTENDLLDIHRYMLAKVLRAGGRIDDIYYCIAADDNHPDRKPNPGMAHKARTKYPEIVFEKSIMVGDKSSDMQWASNIGAHGVLITTTPYLGCEEDTESDYRCDSLFTFAMHCKRLVKTKV